MRLLLVALALAIPTQHHHRPPDHGLATMPWCTWGPESGGSYTAYNAASGAAGKYQILESTWVAFGGPPRHSPRMQEIIARRIAFTGWHHGPHQVPPQGLTAWVGC